MTAKTSIHNDAQTLVLAGSYAEYLSWRKENPSIRRCKYVERVEDIAGINGFLADIVLYGSYETSSVYNSSVMKRILAEKTSPFRAYIH
ncbi:MAG: hypothetical protein AUK48_06795 [Oscillatoriales cyanobacterium CG2_30_44_21]|nr:MAG: hypothetical protein AUK48_06795 [Oscillatoriales cyanobacterium CG2_30_44_21]